MLDVLRPSDLTDKLKSTSVFYFILSTQDYYSATVRVSRDRCNNPISRLALFM